MSLQTMPQLRRGVKVQEGRHEPPDYAATEKGGEGTRGKT